jgi:uncharacterized protein involved in exopolysaccharide biosynthesis
MAAEALRLGTESSAGWSPELKTVVENRASLKRKRGGVQEEATEMRTKKRSKIDALRAQQAALSKQIEQQEMALYDLKDHDG